MSILSNLAFFISEYNNHDLTLASKFNTMLININPFKGSPVRLTKERLTSTLVDLLCLGVGLFLMQLTKWRVSK
ncbi:hypothetical protein A4W77_05475 [Latilactobacillus curvatus]|nr:hypothetical protein A4W77_05475 [Latilactobacillus curvatus]